MDSTAQRLFSRKGIVSGLAVGLGLIAGFSTMTAATAPGRIASYNAISNADAEAIDTTIKRLYACISGPKGAERDFETLRAVHTEDARMTVVRPSGAGPFVMTVDEYIERAGEMLVNSGFREKEIHRETQVFGGIAHVFSTYASTHENDKGEEVPYFRGINSIQLVKIGDEWKVFSILWDNETGTNKIPAQYDEGAGQLHEHADHDDEDDHEDHDDDDDDR
ncbi:MAG: nuclear transport factor 2 family protein [Phycisphaeraceae bacterium]|nr:nuclear transport factor 2 family protein [Phycisphaerales bacterium]MCB9858920.1 nuclear transport factor 2 family protein [Phycisphaeraceae bacterium]